MLCPWLNTYREEKKLSFLFLSQISFFTRPPRLVRNAGHRSQGIGHRAADDRAPPVNEISTVNAR